MASKKWDLKRGYGVYQSVYTEALQRWIREGRIKEGEVFVWTSGLGGWRRPEALDEFRWIFLERKREERIVPPVVPVKKRKRKGKGKKKRRYPKVVIIDDEKEMCWLLENDLKKRHFSVRSVNTGREGFKLVKDEKPDVALLDLKLKDADGLNVLRKIKELRPKRKVIIISAFGDSAIREKADKLGADGFVDKPFKPEDVAKLMRAV